MSVPPKSAQTPDAHKAGVVIAEMTAEEVRAERLRVRPLCDALRLFHFCGRAACRKARACRGDAIDCFETGSDLAPEKVFEWVAFYLDEANTTGADLDAIKEAWPEEHAAYEGWIAALAARERSRAGR